MDKLIFFRSVLLPSEGGDTLPTQKESGESALAVESSLGFYFASVFIPTFQLLLGPLCCASRSLHDQNRWYVNHVVWRKRRGEDGVGVLDPGYPAATCLALALHCVHLQLLS